MRFVTLFLFMLNAYAQIKPVDQQYISQENLLLNPGLEQGRVNWTISGTATSSLEQTASLVLSGLSSLKFVASSQTFEAAQFTTKSAASLNGMQAMASVRVKTNQSGVQVCSIENSVQVKCVDVESNNQAREYIIPFVFNSTNNGIVIKATSGTGTTYIDDAYVGIMPANRMPEISQAQILAFSQYGTSCNFLKTTAGFANFPNVSACDSTPKNVVSNFSGSLVLADTDNLIFTLNNMPAGEYDVVATISRIEADASGELGCIRVSDGAISGAGSCHVDNNTSAIGGVTAKLQFSINSTTNKTFSLQGSDINAITATNVINDDARVNWTVRYYPPKSKVYSGSTIYPHAQLWGTVSYTGVTNCTWDLTNTAFTNYSADADCNNPTATGRINAPSTKIPAFVLPAGSPIGTYKIVARSGFGGGAAGGRDQSFRFSDGTNVTTAGDIYQSNSIPLYPEISGQITYTSTISSAQTIQIQGRASSGAAQINASNSIWGLFFEVYYFPPQDNPIIGTFEGIEKCADDFECTDTFSAKVSSAGVVSDENLDWINGNCVVSGTSLFTCSYNSGIATVSMNCTATVETAGATARTAQIESNSSSSIGIRTREGGSAVAQAFHIACQKQGSDYKPKTAKAATTNEMMYVPNVTRPKTCYYAFGGASATLASPTACSTGTCVEVYDSCSIGSAPTYSGTVGLYNNFTIANSTYKASVPLDCKCIAFGTAAAQYRQCVFTNDTGDQTWSTTVNGGAVLNLYTSQVDGVGQNTYVLIKCEADAP